MILKRKVLLADIAQFYKSSFQKILVASSFKCLFLIPRCNVKVNSRIKVRREIKVRCEDVRLKANLINL